MHTIHLKSRHGILMGIKPFRIAVLILFPFLWQACAENEFPVSPLPETFEFIPPNDVNLLTATGGDQKVTLKWGENINNDLKAIHIKNLNTGKEETVQGNVSEAVITGLTNLVKYTFEVKTENNQELLSYGTTISAKPFVHDNVKPGIVTDLRGFKLNATTALAAWANPADNDLDRIVVYLGKDSIVVSSTLSFGSIRGNLTDKVIVRAVDLSGNYSDPVETVADKDLVEISGYDDGTTQTIRLYKDPVITVVDEYVISYFDSETHIKGPLEEITEYAMSMDDGRNLWLDDAKTKPTWLEPIKIKLMYEGSEVSTSNYYAYNDIPGSVFATHFTAKSEAIQREGEGNGFTSNIGWLSDNLFCEYDINVLEDGEYTVVAYGSRPDSNTGKYDVAIDGTVLAQGEITGQNGWGNYAPFTGPDINLEKGKHKLRINFTTGNNNYRKFVFIKK